MAYYQGCIITIEVPEGFDDALLRNALTNKLPGIAIEIRRNSQLLRPKVIEAFVPETHGLIHDETQRDFHSDEWHSARALTTPKGISDGPIARITTLPGSPA